MTGREACAEGGEERLSQRPSRGSAWAPADSADSLYLEWRRRRERERKYEASL
jgi:hypothetical protein